MLLANSFPVDVNKDMVSSRIVACIPVKILPLHGLSLAADG
jgi:hypothetical protein